MLDWWGVTLFSSLFPSFVYEGLTYQRGSPNPSEALSQKSFYLPDITLSWIAVVEHSTVQHPILSHGIIPANQLMLIWTMLVLVVLTFANTTAVGYS